VKGFKTITKDEDNETTLWGRPTPIGEATLAHAIEDCKLNQGGDFCTLFYGTKGESLNSSARLDMVFAHELGIVLG
jgi:hypothetical protein